MAFNFLKMALNPLERTDWRLWSVELLGGENADSSLIARRRSNSSNVGRWRVENILSDFYFFKS